MCAGVMLSLIGDIIINIGMNAMKHAHNINTDPETNAPIKHFTRIPWWWMGIFGIIGGEVGNLIAYGYAPASIVTPIGSIGVVTNVLITTFVLKEPFTMKNLIGVVCVIVGIVVVVMFAPLTVIFVGSENLWEDVIYTSNMAIYLSWMAVMLAVLYPLSRKYGDKTVVIYVALCAVIASLTIVCAKTFATMVSNGFANGMETEFLSPWPYGTLAVMVLTCVLSMSYVNRAMMTFGNSQVVPVYFALFTTAGVGSAAWVYQEFQCLADANQALGFFIGISIAILGVFLVSQGGGSRKVSPEAAYVDDDEKERDCEQGQSANVAEDCTAPRGNGSKGPSASGANSGAGPTPDDVSPCTPPGPEGAGHDVESGGISMARPESAGMCDATQNRQWMQHEATLHLQQQQRPHSPSEGYAAARSELSAVQPLAPVHLRNVDLPQSESPPRSKREKQAKGIRCGLTMLKPLPPLVLEGRDPVDGQARAKARPACDSAVVVNLPALPRVVTSPSPPRR